MDKPRKEDRRSKMTRALIRTALMELLETKPVGNISVSELCRAADISRGTFYAHYNTPEDVLWEVQDEVTRKLTDREISGKLSVYDYILYDCQICLENRDFCMMLMRDPTTRAMYQRGLLEKSPAVAGLGDLPAHPTREQSVARFWILCMAEGIGGIINDWCERGMVESPELVAQICADFSETCEMVRAKWA